MNAFAPTPDLLLKAAVVCCTLALGACASTEPQTVDATDEAAVATPETSVASAEPVGTGEVAPIGKDPNEMICRRERATGSHFSRRVCRTRAQREADAEAAQEAMRRRLGSGMDPAGAGAPTGG